MRSNNERAVKPENRAVSGVAQRRSSANDCLEHRCQLTGRGINDPSTSAVAVCFSKASRVSVSRRAFSMAMTACAAIFATSSTCCPRRAVPPGEHGDQADQLVMLEQWHTDDGAGAGELGERVVAIFRATLLSKLL